MAEAMDTDEQNCFSIQLKAMMYSFGDVREPLKESIDTVYSVLRETMNDVLFELERIANFRKSEIITHEDVIFLVKRNKGKLKRMIEYLTVMDDMSKFRESTFENPDVEMAENVSKRKRADICKQFLADMDESGELTALFEDVSIIDEAYKKILKRRSDMTKWMDTNEYIEFTERIMPTSFCAKEQFYDFEVWLMQDKLISFELSRLASEMIMFLARETVLMTVDLALELKERSEKAEKRESPEHCIPYFNFHKVALECNFSDLQSSSSSSSEKSFKSNSNHASGSANEPLELRITNVAAEHKTTKDPESITTETVLSSPTVEWTDGLGNSYYVSSFPGTSMDIFYEKKPEDHVFISHSDTNSSECIFQSTTSVEDTNSGNPMEGTSFQFQNVGSIQVVVSNRIDESAIENVSDDESSAKNQTCDATLSDTRFSSNDKSENSMRKCLQEFSESELPNQNQTPIRRTHIIQAVGQFNMHSSSPICNSRQTQPTTMLLCIDDFDLYDF